MKTVHVVTAFLCQQDKILILKRSAQVGSYRGCWAAVSGYLEEDTPLLQALKEIREETGLPETALRLLCQGEPLKVEDDNLQRCWVVHPFRFEVVSGADDIVLDWEHDEMRWIDPEQLGMFDTVPLLEEVYVGCVPTMRLGNCVPIKPAGNQSKAAT